MQQTNLPYEENIEDGYILYKITIEKILGGLYGNIYQNGKRIYTSEISKLIFIELFKKYGEDYPLEYLKNNLKERVNLYINQNPENIAEIIVNNLKEKNDNQKYSLKKLYDDWLELDSGLKEKVFEILKKNKDKSIFIDGDSIDMLLLRKVEG